MEHTVTPVREANAEQRPPERTLARRELSVERKRVTIFLKENARGKFVRITEESYHGRMNSIAIPLPGLTDFMRALEAVIDKVPRAET